MKHTQFDKLSVKILNTRKEMGECAANDICATINVLLKTKEQINMIFAAAPSQNEVLESLTKKDINWAKINAFHMDEYIGLDDNAPQRFGNYLNEHIFGKVPFASVNYINPNTSNPNEEINRYSELLKDNPVDIVVMGIGENGHIAFNDPPVADFKDPLLVKPVPLDEMCRMQQVHDGCFKKIDDVPTHAITLTIPTLMNAKYLFCIVPSLAKANAVYSTLYGQINERTPASILRTHNSATLYLDLDSSERIVL